MSGHGLDLSAPPPSTTLGRIEEWLPTGAVVLLAVGILVLLDGAGAGTPARVLAGGVAVGVSLVLLVACGAVDGLVLLGLSLPLPGLITGEQVRISPAAALTAVVIMAWLVAHATDERRPWWGALPRRAAAAFLGAMVLSTLFSQHKVAAVRELTDLSLMIGLLIVATHQLSRSPSRVPRLVELIAAVAGLAGAFAVLQTLGLAPSRFPLPGTSVYRATAGFGWPNELGMFMAIALPLSIHAYQKAEGPGQKLIAFASLAAATMGLAATFSRGSWLAFAAATPLLLLLAGDRKFALRTFLGMAAAVLAIDLLSGGVISGRVAAISSDPYVGQRVALMLTGVVMFRAYPVLGVGPGGFAESLPDFGPRIPWLWDYVGSSHNAYLEFAAETGIIGLTAFVVLVVTIFRVLLRGARRASRESMPPGDRSLRRALLWSFGVFCVVSLTGWTFAHGIGQLAMLVAAMGLALEAGTEPTAEAGLARLDTAGEAA